MSLLRELVCLKYFLHACKRLLGSPAEKICQLINQSIIKNKEICIYRRLFSRLFYDVYTVATSQKQILNYQSLVVSFAKSC